MKGEMQNTASKMDKFHEQLVDVINNIENDLTRNTNAIAGFDAKFAQITNLSVEVVVDKAKCSRDEILPKACLFCCIGDIFHGRWLSPPFLEFSPPSEYMCFV